MDKKKELLDRMRKLAGGALLTLITFAAFARAASTDSVVVTVRPNAYYAVSIDTTNVSMNLGTVNLGASTQTVSPATVTIQSSFATTDLKIRGSISSPGGTAWTFDDNTTSSDTDKVAVWATFTSIARSSAPTQSGDYFSGTIPAASGSDVLSSTDRYVGNSASDSTTNLFVNGSNFDSKVMDSLAPNAQADLWLYLRLPSATTSATAQNISIIITAVTPN